MNTKVKFPIVVLALFLNNIVLAQKEITRSVTILRIQKKIVQSTSKIYNDTGLVSSEIKVDYLTNDTYLTLYDYDAFKNEVSRINFMNGIASDSVLSNYGYFDDRVLSVEIDHSNEFMNQKHNILYDSLGKKTREVFVTEIPNIGPITSSITTYFYDSSGRLTKETKQANDSSLNNYTIYNYLENGNLSNMKKYSKNDIVEENRFYYDQNNNVSRSVFVNYVTTNKYDPTIKSTLDSVCQNTERKKKIGGKTKEVFWFDNSPGKNISWYNDSKQEIKQKLKIKRRTDSVTKIIYKSTDHSRITCHLRRTNKVFGIIPIFTEFKRIEEYFE
jgi:hypothetical protein